MRNQRTQPPDPQPVSAAPSALGFRLRHVLLLAILGVLGWQFAPRAEAAWTLRERATQFADYALCMAGPTGPSTLRDQPELFRELVRRRLLVSAPEQAPFADCGGLAAAVSGDPSVQAAHLLAAEQFVEYGGKATRKVQGAGRLSDPGIGTLDQLAVSTRVLAELARAAWPFERGGYTRLVKASSHAKEAPHPVEFPTPAFGSGLPPEPALYVSAWHDAGRWLLAHSAARGLSVFESRDGGAGWRPVPVNQPGLEAHAGRCVAAGSINSFTFQALPGGVLVQSWFGDQMQHAARISDVGGIVRVSCDEQTALMALVKGERRSLLACRHAGTCTSVATEPEWLSGSFDIARVAGVSVLSTSEFGIVRVRSSRDDGKSWTPATIAFDWRAARKLGAAAVPSRFVTMGQRILLLGQAEAGAAYPLLVSDDFGASFRTPSALSATGTPSAPAPQSAPTQPAREQPISSR